MRCAIVQPSYIPWRGYFDLIRRSDVFVFYDDVQYDKHGWRNRNRIKTANGPTWLTIPVAKKGNVAHQVPINEIDIVNEKPWNRKHLATLRQSYAAAPYFGRYEKLVETLLADPPAKLADFTIAGTIALAQALGVAPRFVRASELGVTGAKTDRLVGILQQLGASHYISGPSARAYLDEDRLRRANISLEYMAYEYRAYPQLHPPYDPHVSVVDLLFMTGPEAAAFLE